MGSWAVGRVGGAPGVVRKRKVHSRPQGLMNTAKRKAASSVHLGCGGLGMS